MSYVELTQVEELIYEFTQQDLEFGNFVAEVHFLLESMETLAGHDSCFPELSQFGWYLTACQLKDRAKYLSQSNHYLLGLMNAVLKSEIELEIV